MKSHRIAGCVFVVLGLFAMPAAACHIVTVYAGPDQVVCVGSTVSVSVSSTTCNSGCTTFSYVWSAPGGSPSSGTGSSFSCYYDATKTGTRTITVTATCAGGASGQASVQVTVVGVGSVTASKTTVYIGKSGGRTPVRPHGEIGNRPDRETPKRIRRPFRDICNTAPETARHT